MINWINEALDLIDTGIIILDSKLSVKFWNKKIEKISQIPTNVVLGRKLSDVCDKFCIKKYQDILEQVFKTGQNRFCSSTIHKAFVYDKNANDVEKIRQNMFVQPILNGEQVEYLLIQITDRTDSIQNEIKLRGFIDELKKDYYEAKESEKHNSMLAKYDTLTALYNRYSLENELAKIIENHKNSNKKFALLFIDLDGFKLVNDTYGHILGDVLLQQVAGRCKSNTKKRDVISRIGGDEFLIILTENESIDYYSSIAQILVDAIKRPYIIDNKIVDMSSSIGLAIFPDHAFEANELIKKADHAMYKAKQDGKNGYRIYKSEYDTITYRFDTVHYSNY